MRPTPATRVSPLAFLVAARRPRVDALPVAIGRADLGTSRASLFFERELALAAILRARERTRPIAMATSSGVANGVASRETWQGSRPDRLRGGVPPASRRERPRAREGGALGVLLLLDRLHHDDPAAMVLPMDDHMAHRGHGVFDTAHLHAGHLHMLDRHVSRFFKKHARGEHPAPIRPRRRRSSCASPPPAVRARAIRFYASAGPGGFALDQTECVKSVFYCVAVKKRCQEENSPEKTNDATNDATNRMKNESRRRRGDLLRADQAPAFATVKSTNYLPNALVVADAKRRGAQYGIWLTEDGKHVAEGPSMNVGFAVRRASRRFDENDERDGTRIEEDGSTSASVATELRFLTPPWTRPRRGARWRARWSL